MHQNKPLISITFSNFICIYTYSFLLRFVRWKGRMTEKVDVKEKVGGEGEERIFHFHLLVQLQNGCKSQIGFRLKTKVRNWVQFSLVECEDLSISTIICCLSRCFSRKLDSGEHCRSDLRFGDHSGGLTHCAEMLDPQRYS